MTWMLEPFVVPAAASQVETAWSDMPYASLTHAYGWPGGYRRGARRASQNWGALGIADRRQSLECKARRVPSAARTPASPPVPALTGMSGQ